jgi:hypothetical protein
MWILAHLCKTLSHRSVADSHFRRNLPDACPGRTESENFIAINDPGRAAKLLTSALALRTPAVTRWRIKVAFQLSDGGNNRKQCLSERAFRLNVERLHIDNDDAVAMYLDDAQMHQFLQSSRNYLPD